MPLPTKAKNVVALAVNNIYGKHGIGSPGVVRTDTNHGLYIGGHPRLNAGKDLQYRPYIGCIKRIVINKDKLDVTSEMIKGHTYRPKSSYTQISNYLGKLARWLFSKNL